MDVAADFSLGGRKALVTGSARGLGRAIAIALAHAGADVALGLRDANTAADVVEAIEATGRRAVRLQMDMSRLTELRAAVAEADNALDGLDILVNNAGIGRVSMADSVTVEDFDTTLRINLAGTFFASQAAAVLMRQRGFGRIVNIGSQAGLVGTARRVRVLHD
jgi:NAD(P)-dependent dehydrogenase (short-subunit alcohol dehydrogenase family)